MAYHKLPSIKHYWMQSNDMGVQCIQQAMTRDRFLFILGKLHLNDNNGRSPDNMDKLWKIRPLVEGLNQVFKENKLPMEHLSIDESMIRFKGRCSFKQYNPMKPIKREYKLWCVADNCGYAYKFEIYIGKNGDSTSDSFKDLGLGGQVVWQLAESLKGKWHRLFFDNYFSSVPLMELLQVNHIFACATIRPTRKDVPVMAADNSLKRGDFDYRSTPDGISVYKWRDNRPVHFILNYHNPTVTTVKRKQKDGSKLVVACPEVVKHYNENMGGVDKHDMLRQMYGVNRKSMKWWHRIFFGLLDMTIVNAYALYCDAKDKPVSLLMFRRELAQGLFTLGKTRRSMGAPKCRKLAYSVPDSVRLSSTGVHWPEFTDKKSRFPYAATAVYTFAAINQKITL